MKSRLLKKIFSAVLAGTAAFCLAACSGGTESAPAASDQTEVNADSQVAEEPADAVTEENTGDGAGSSEEDGGALIVYFSWSGNTEAVAREIQSQTGADLFEIVPAEPYTDDYDELLDIAQEEQSSDARPAIADTVELSGYDTVYLGFPNWWGDMPMIIYTFLDEYDLSGKTIAPFNTSGGSGFSDSLDTIAEMEPDAEITEGLSLGSSEAEDCSDTVSGWLGSIGLAE
ncbi:MAG TPA: flavodoxin [Candidatus Mediterraneibacter stercoravium]|uniref:Flavodoxin n=1 Tax=Candidatus Mediterraneibacter stercoravium TaxID=2838685 RepID=A0A9D2G6P8_9FIRM|nr:flavodoxin [Candidatus Mediterraneibacter stercoravium]